MHGEAPFVGMGAYLPNCIFDAAWFKVVAGMGHVPNQLMAQSWFAPDLDDAAKKREAHNTWPLMLSTCQKLHDTRGTLFHIAGINMLADAMTKGYPTMALRDHIMHTELEFRTGKEDEQIEAVYSSARKSANTVASPKPRRTKKQKLKAQEMLDETLQTAADMQTDASDASEAAVVHEAQDIATVLDEAANSVETPELLIAVAAEGAIPTLDPGHDALWDAAQHKLWTAMHSAYLLVNRGRDADTSLFLAARKADESHEAAFTASPMDRDNDGGLDSLRSFAETIDATEQTDGLSRDYARTAHELDVWMARAKMLEYYVKTDNGVAWYQGLESLARAYHLALEDNKESWDPYNESMKRAKFRFWRTRISNDDFGTWQEMPKYKARMGKTLRAFEVILDHICEAAARHIRRRDVVQEVLAEMLELVKDALQDIDAAGILERADYAKAGLLQKPWRLMDKEEEDEWEMEWGHTRSHLADKIKTARTLKLPAPPRSCIKGSKEAQRRQELEWHRAFEANKEMLRVLTRDILSVASGDDTCSSHSRMRDPFALLRQRLGPEASGHDARACLQAAEELDRTLHEIWVLSFYAESMRAQRWLRNIGRVMMLTHEALLDAGEHREVLQEPFRRALARACKLNIQKEDFAVRQPRYGGGTEEHRRTLKEIRIIAQYLSTAPFDNVSNVAEVTRVIQVVNVILEEAFGTLNLEDILIKADLIRVGRACHLDNTTQPEDRPERAQRRLSFASGTK